MSGCRPKVATLLSAMRVLEVQLQRELNLPRSHDRRLRPPGESSQATWLIDAAECTCQRSAYVEVVEAVEALRAELHVQPLRNLRVLGDGEVRGKRARTAQTVALDIPQETRSLGFIARGIEPLCACLEPRCRVEDCFFEEVVWMASGRERIVRVCAPLGPQVRGIVERSIVIDVQRQASVNAHDRPKLPSLDKAVSFERQGVKEIAADVVANVEGAVHVRKPLVVTTDDQLGEF